MTLIRWAPPANTVQDLVGMQDEMNRLFDSVFGRGSSRGQRDFPFTPAVDIEETPEGFVLRADLPGVSQKDVKVSLMGDTLTIRGERRRDASDNLTPLRTERLYGSFERSFTLGTTVRADSVKASYRDGVLEVFVPKAEEARLREIQVQVG